MKYLLFKDNILVARYDSDINSDIPTDSIEVEDDVYWNTINNQNDIWYLDGTDIKSKQPSVPVLSREDVDSLRIKAYADPVNGSDRYLNEVSSRILLGDVATSDKIKALQQKALDTKALIKKQYPWPAA